MRFETSPNGVVIVGHSIFDTPGYKSILRRNNLQAYGTLPPLQYIHIYDLGTYTRSQDLSTFAKS